jgi:hypothetical protein
MCIEFCSHEKRCTGVRNVILGKYDSWWGCDIIPRTVRDIFGDDICSDNELNSYGYEGGFSKYYRCPPLYDRAKKLKDKIDRYNGVKSSHDDKRVFLEMQVLIGVEIIRCIGKNLGFDVEKFRDNVESYIEYEENLVEYLNNEMEFNLSIDLDCDTKYYERDMAKVNHVKNCFRRLLKEKDNVGFTKKALVSDKKPSKSTTKKSASKSTKASSTSKGKTASCESERSTGPKTSSTSKNSSNKRRAVIQ